MTSYEAAASLALSEAPRWKQKGCLTGGASHHFAITWKMTIATVPATIRPAITSAKTLYSPIRTVSFVFFAFLLLMILSLTGKPGVFNIDLRYISEGGRQIAR